MILRVLHAKLADALQRAAQTIGANVYIDVHRYHGCAFVGRNPGHGFGYIQDCECADNWPDGARLLTIGRVTLAAWGGRSS